MALAAAGSPYGQLGLPLVKLRLTLGESRLARVELSLTRFKLFPGLRPSFLQGHRASVRGSRWLVTLG